MLLLCLCRPDFLSQERACPGAVVTSVLLAIAILLGILSGFTIRRLSSGRKVGTRERNLLEILGWTLMGLWLMLALLLLTWAAASHA
jgi:hypothetical protein